MMTSWQIQQVLDGATRRAAAQPSTGGQTFTAPRAEPHHEQRQILADCVRRSRAAGLTLPTVGVYWVAPPEGVAPAAFRRRQARSDIALSVLLSPWDLMRCAYHELSHCADVQQYGTHGLTREQLEVRAERFADRMMRQEQA